MPGKSQTGMGFLPLGESKGDANPAHLSSDSRASMSNTLDLEHRLRNMIVNNQSNSLDQGRNEEPGLAKHQYQNLPPHMRSASAGEQDEYLRNSSNVRAKGFQGSVQQHTRPSPTNRRKQQHQKNPPNQSSAQSTQTYTVDSQTQDHLMPQVQPSPLQVAPPHLQGSAPEVQQDHLVTKETSKESSPNPAQPKKRLNQKERRKQQKEHGQLGLLDQPPSQPTLSGSRGSRNQAPSLPVDHATYSEQHPYHLPQEAPKFMHSSVAPYSSQSFHPQPSPKSTSYHVSGPDRAFHQSPTPRTSYKPLIGSDQQIGPKQFPQNNRGSRGGFSHPQGSSRQSSISQQTYHSHDYERPSPQYRQLYDPRRHLGFNSHSRSQASQMHNLPLLSPAEQIRYLDSISTYEIPKASMNPSDLAAKDHMRRILEGLCREAVVNHEREKNENFDATGVKLECFGSLNSGFATVGSDMDLVLLSPESTPSTASPDSKIPRLLEKALLDCGYGARLLTRTRVPIIKFCESPTPELREALVQERAKWEKSLLEPPKPEKQRKQKVPTKETEGGEKGDEKDDADQGKKKRKKPNRKKKIGVNVTPSETNSQHRQSESAASTPELPVMPEEDGVTREENIEKEIEATSEPSEPNGSNDDAREGHGNNATAPEEQGEGVSETGMNGPEVADEKDEEHWPHRPSSKYRAIMRSAEELIRLYRLAMSEGWFEKKERVVIFHFIDVFEGRSQGLGHVELHEAWEALKDLPDVLSRYRDKPDDTLEFPKTGLGVQCDINFSNVLALHNTELLRCYSLCDPRIQQMVIFVKAWSKQRKINTPYRGTLSSYGYVLMILHFVVNVACPPLAPNLQRHPFAQGPDVQGSQLTEVDGFDIQFWRDEHVIRHAAHQHILLPRRNEESVGSLLRGFFLYFSQQGYNVPKGGFCWAQDVLSLRTEGGLLTKKEKDWTGAKRTIVKATSPGQGDREIQHRYLFAIEDPFEVDHNVARTVIHEGIVAIRDEFRRALRIIQNGGMGRDGKPVNLFEEGQELPSQRTFFGPKPRPFIGPLNLAKELRPKDPYGTEGEKKIGVDKVGKGKTDTPGVVDGVLLGEENGGMHLKAEI